MGVLVFLVIVVGGGYLGFQYYEQKSQEKALIEKRKKELQEMRKKEAERERIRAEQERQRQAEIAAHYTRRRRTAPRPVRASTPRSGERHRRLVESICRKARCHLVKYEEKGDTSYIVVEGPDHNSVSDILDPLISAGMRDFSEDKRKFSVRRIGVRRIYTAAYTLKW